jgi:hypothetical protein
MGGGMGGGMGFAHSASFAGGAHSFAGPRSVAFTGNRFAFAHNRFAFAHQHFPFRHHFRNRFFFAAAFPYGYDDGCLARVWTPWGWRWRNVCSY